MKSEQTQKKQRQPYQNNGHADHETEMNPEIPAFNKSFYRHCCLVTEQLIILNFIACEK